MKLSRKLAFVFIPLTLAIAGCHTIKPAPKEPAQQAQQQGASLAVYQASNTQVQGFRAVPLNKQQVIYVSQDPVFTRSEVASIEAVKDQQKNDYLSLTLTPQGLAALKQVPANRGYVTVIGGQVASLTGIQQDNLFLFRTRDQEVSKAIIKSVFPQENAAKSSGK